MKQNYQIIVIGAGAEPGANVFFPEKTERP
jgi:hypothetical protein